MPKPERPTYLRGLPVRRRIERDAEIAQDLRAEADLAPLRRPLAFRAGRRGAGEFGRHARRAVAQIDQHAAPSSLNRCSTLSIDAAAEDVADDVGAMQPRRHAAAVADRAVDEGEMQHRIERRAIGVDGHLADRRLDRKARDPLDQILARLAIGDEVGDRNALEPVLGGEGLDLRPDHHRAVVVGEFADDRHRRQAGEPAQIDRRLGVAGAHQHAAFAWRPAGRRGRGGRSRPPPCCRLASARTVLQRCSAEMPVVRPCLTSTETVKAVPSGASLTATIGRGAGAALRRRSAARRRCRSRCG